MVTNSVIDRKGLGMTPRTTVTAKPLLMGCAVLVTASLWLAGTTLAAKAASATSSVQACVGAAGGRGSLDACIGKVSEACIGPDEGAKPEREVSQCLYTEQAQWDRLLNTAYQTLAKDLEPDQRVKLRDMQRSWIDTRDKTCQFYYDYFEGSMANPMIANCLNRETARRAIFLRGLASNLANRKQ